jgi:hypothetical protein
MKTSAVCHKCGNVTDADYSPFPLNSDTTDTYGPDRKQVVRIHCPACGPSERSPHCQPDSVDAALLRLLVL